LVRSKALSRTKPEEEKAFSDTSNASVSMKKDPKIIAEEIIKLVSELATLAGASIEISHTPPRQNASAGKKDTSGATGGCPANGRRGWTRLSEKIT